jgi:hypothetical protein
MKIVAAAIAFMEEKPQVTVAGDFLWRSRRRRRLEVEEEMKMKLEGEGVIGGG